MEQRTINLLAALWARFFWSEARGSLRIEYSRENNYLSGIGGTGSRPHIQEQ